MNQENIEMDKKITNHQIEPSPRDAISAYLLGQGKSPEEAANTADQIDFQAKTEKKVEKGECSSEEAVEDLIDRKAAQFCTWIEAHGSQLCEKGCETVGSLIGTLIEPWCPGAVAKGREIGQAIGKKIAPLIVTVSKVGVRLIRDFCKEKWRLWTAGIGVCKKIAPLIKIFA